MNISYDYYRIFYQVARYGNITRAAAALQSNQPNVSRTIHLLEEELGCTLFVRSRSGVQLTPEGERLFEHVRIAIEQIEAGEEELSMRNSLQSGAVNIAASEVALHCLLLPVLKKYRSLYPAVRISVNNDSTPQAISALKNGLADLAVVTTPMELPDAMKSRRLRSVQEVAVCGAGFSHLCDKTLTLDELARYPLICLSRRTQTHAFYSQLFMKHGVDFKPGVEAATADQILPLVASDLGIGFVPEVFLERFRLAEGVRRLVLETPIPPRWICVVRRSGFALSIAARKLEEMLLAERDEA